MTNFAILTDSCSDLTAPLRERFGVDGYVPGALVYPDGSNHYADLDWKNMTPAQFFGTMKDKKGGLFTSAQIGLQDVADRFEPLLQQGRDILFVAVSSGLSGTYNSTCLVANELMEKYPERHIRCVDTLRYCGAEGMLVIAATRLRAAGKTLDETADWLEENRLRVHQMGVLEDLFFCKRMGRVSGAAAVMGTLVGIRPLADINEKGLSDVIGKTRGLAPALKATIDYGPHGRAAGGADHAPVAFGPSGARGGAARHGRGALPPEGAARCTGLPVLRRVDRAGPVRYLLFWPPDLVRPDGGAQPDRGADGKNKIIAREPAAVEPLAPVFCCNLQNLEVMFRNMPNSGVLQQKILEKPVDFPKNAW